MFSLTSISASGWTPCFTIRANGNVGIFNTNPSAALEIGSIGSTQQVKINGSIVFGSDERMKSDIRNIETSISRIKQLRSVSYRFNEDDNAAKASAIPEKVLKNLSSEEIQKIQEELNAVNAVKKKNNRISYGFIAQELQKVLPELVYEDSVGTLSVDYIGVIPFLVKALQEQIEQIEYLQEKMDKMDVSVAVQRINSDASSSNKIKNEQINIDDRTAALYQNAPNPFSQSTQIKYYLPDEVNTALFCIYDINGKQLKQTIINTRGEGLQTISASEFSAGIYLYGLIADGQQVDIKRMILTE